MQFKSLASLRNPYDHVYVSPHFDDVTASCGGRIVNQLDRGEAPLVVTVFSAGRTPLPEPGSPLSSVLNYRRRREEDRLAMQGLGVDFLWLERPEFLFRTQRPWARYWPHFRATPDNNQMVAELVQELRQLCRQTGCRRLTLPLGVGQHMDHQMLFQVGRRLLSDRERSPRIDFYEETPYAMFPFLLVYRLKKIGLNRTLVDRLMRPADNSRGMSARAAYHIWTSVPSLGLQHPLLRPWGFLSLLWLDVYTCWLMKPSPPALPCGDLWPVVWDITPVIDRKLRAISTYRSQLPGPSFSRDRVKCALAAYGSSLGMPAGCFGERYWQTPAPDGCSDDA